MKSNICQRCEVFLRVNPSRQTFSCWMKSKINHWLMSLTSFETLQLCQPAGHWAPAFVLSRWRRGVCAPAASQCEQRRSPARRCEGRHLSLNICGEPCGPEPIQRYHSVGPSKDGDYTRYRHNTVLTRQWKLLLSQRQVRAVIFRYLKCHGVSNTKKDL